MIPDDPVDGVLDFLRELKRRNVYRVAVAYLAVAFAGIQAARLLVPPTTLPAWADDLLIYVAAFGFPVGLVLAWALEMTPEGVERTDSAARNRGSAPGSGARGGDAGSPSPESDAAARRARDRPDGGSRRPSVAVLPFDDMSPDGDQAYFADGLAEELLDARTKLRRIRVAARTSSFAYRERQADVWEIARDLGVDHVLEGSVRKSNGNLRITAQLVEAENGYHLWSETYDTELGDVFEVQDRIASSVVDHLRGKLLEDDGRDGSHDGRIVEASTRSPEAYEHYLKGTHFWHQRHEKGLRRALEHFEIAAEADPEYAEPRLGIATVNVAVAVYRMAPPRGPRERTEEAILRALELSPDLADARVLEALIAYSGEALRTDRDEVDLERADRASRRALDLNPDSAEAHAVRAFYLAHRGVPAWPEVREYAERARSLAPRSERVHQYRALAAVGAGRYRSASRYAEEALEQEPTSVLALFTRGIALSGAGEHGPAVRALERAASLADRAPFVLGWLGAGYGAAGRTADAESVLTELEEQAQEGRMVAPIFPGSVKAAMGAEEALDDLERELEVCGTVGCTFLQFPFWEDFWDRPRFRRLADRAGLGAAPLDQWSA